MKLLSVVTPCYNEEENVEEVYLQAKQIFDKLPKYKYEHIFIDNNSQDKTVKILKNIAKTDKNIKLIVNAKNFGPARSGAYAIFQTKGDAVITLNADLQDPPELIRDFILQWEKGNKIVIGIKKEKSHTFIAKVIRKLFDFIVNKISETDYIKNFSGFGLYDKEFIDIIKKFDDPNPYLKGLISEFGYNRFEIPYIQNKRKRGKSSYNFYRYYDYAMMAFVNHSKLPLRLSCFIGFFTAIISLITAIIYFILKIIYWSQFSLGMAPLIIGLFFLSSIQLFFIGVIGEYIGAIYTQVKKRPLIIGKERINFD